MITVRRARTRTHEHGRNSEVWHTFDRAADEAGAPIFGALEALDEYRLSAGARIQPRARDGLEVVTYVREGALAYEDAEGRSNVIQAGEFQRTTSGARGRANAIRGQPAHLFRVGVRSAESVDPSEEHRRFGTADRRGIVCAVASPDGRRGSLRIHQDAVVHSAILATGQHVIHDLSHGRSAWLHLVQGDARLGDLVLRTGDGAGLTSEPALSLTAREPTEILLVDLGGPPRLDHPGGAA